MNKTNNESSHFKLISHDTRQERTTPASPERYRTQMDRYHGATHMDRYTRISIHDCAWDQNRKGQRDRGRPENPEAEMKSLLMMRTWSVDLMMEDITI
jgi:hypothetical protein